MAYDPGAIDATLAAAVGDDPALMAELREAFLDSAKAGLRTLELAESDEAWREAGLRLKGLAASFGAVRLMALAGDLVEARPHDPEQMRKARRAIARL